MADVIEFPEELADELGYLINGRATTKERIQELMTKMNVELTDESFSKFVEERRANTIESNRVYVKNIPKDAPDCTYSILHLYKELYAAKKRKGKCINSFLYTLDVFYKNIEIFRSASGKMYNKNFEKLFSGLEDKLSFNFGRSKFDIYQKGVYEYGYFETYQISFTAPFDKNAKFILSEEEVESLKERAEKYKSELEEIKKICSKEYVYQLINVTAKEIETCKSLINSGDDFQREVKRKILK